jgi:MarR family transcriptional regulator, temperature-dependent positive regulator of motility
MCADYTPAVESTTTTKTAPKVVRARPTGLPHQLRRATQAFGAVWQQLVPDLTPPQYAALSVLAEHSELDQSTLGGLASIDRSTLTPLLDRLESRGLITKTIDPANRRRRLLELTDDGRQLFAQTYEHTVAIQQWLDDTLGASRAAQLAELLRELGDAAPPA